MERTYVVLLGTRKGRETALLEGTEAARVHHRLSDDVVYPELSRHFNRSKREQGTVHFGKVPVLGSV